MTAAPQHRRPRPRARLARSLAKATLARNPLRFLEHMVGEKGDVARLPSASAASWSCLCAPSTSTRSWCGSTAPSAASTCRGLHLAQPLLDEGLLSVDGEDHQRQRAQLKPRFHHERLGDHALLAATSAARWSAGWRDGQRLDMADEMEPEGPHRLPRQPPGSRPVVTIRRRENYPRPDLVKRLTPAAPASPG